MEVLKMSNKQLAILAGVLFVAVIAVFFVKGRFYGTQPERNWSEWNQPPVLGEQDSIDKPENPDKPEPAPVTPDEQGQIMPRTFREALVESVRTKKNIFLFFETDNCEWCKKMKEVTFVDPNVRKKLSNYVVYYCDAKKERLLVARYKVHGVPCYFVINEYQQVFNKAQGYKNPEDFFNWLR
jgi:thiol:disulfide interchange protein